MNFWYILLIIIGITIIIFALLNHFGKKIEKRNKQNQEQIEATSQTHKILVIDKKKMKLRDANLPKQVLEQTPKYLRRSKVPILKVKIGPRILTMMCDPKIYDIIPTKQEVLATFSGIYVTNVKGKLLPKPKKKSLKDKLFSKFKKDN